MGNAARRIAASALPPIPPDHLRLTHNTSSPHTLENIQNGDPFRFAHSDIGLTTDPYSTNDQVAEAISSGRRDMFGPLTLLIDLPVDEHNKRLGRFGWQGYEPVPNQNVIGHVDANGVFVPIARNPDGQPSNYALLNESQVKPYVQKVPQRRGGGYPVPPQSQPAPQVPTLSGLLDPNDIW
jgi:hypothetical protein